MEEAIEKLRTRHGRQEKLNSELNGFSRRQSNCFFPRKASILLPISNMNRKQSFKEKRTRAQSMWTMDLSSNGEVETTIKSQRFCKLPSLGLSRRFSMKPNFQWRAPPRRLSAQDDCFIMKHLRRKLLQQHERRSLEYEEEINAFEAEEEDVDSEDDDMMQWIQSVRSRGPSLSTMNFSSTATSRQTNYQDMGGDSPRSAGEGSPPLVPDPAISGVCLLQARVHDDGQEKKPAPHFPPPLVSRPSICISFAHDGAEWIQDEDTGCAVSSPSALNRSMTSSERSVGLLMQRSRRRSLLSEIPESNGELHNTNHSPSDLPLSSIGRLSPIRYEFPETHSENALLDHTKPPDHDNVYSNLPIGEVSLFSDWKSTSGSMDQRLSSSPPNCGDNTTGNALSSHNSFLSTLRPTTTHSSLTRGTNEDGPTMTDLHSSSFFNRLDDCDVSRLKALKRIYLGDVSVATSQLKKVVSIYMSSSGVDSSLERSFLQGTMTSQLRHFCAERRLSFEVIDLGSFPSEFKTHPLDTESFLVWAHNGQDLSRLRSKLISKCYKSSVGPWFMSFLGTTVGSQWNLPQAISPEIFHHVQHMMGEEISDLIARLDVIKTAPLRSGAGQESKNHFKNSFEVPGDADTAETQSLELRNKLQQVEFNLNLLKKWYCFDFNAQPPKFVLLNLSDYYDVLGSLGASITNSTDTKKFQTECMHWKNTKTILLNTLETYTKESECKSGAADVDLFNRRITLTTDVEAETSLATSFLRCNESGFWFKRNIVDCNLEDAEAPCFYDINPYAVESTKHVLINQEPRHYEEEVHQHLIFAQSLSPRLIGRNDELHAIKQYLRCRKRRKPFIVYGPAGSGKSSIMARAALNAAKWMECKRERRNTAGLLEETATPCRIIFRSIGLTGDSQHSRLFLEGLCAQLHSLVEDISKVDDVKFSEHKRPQAIEHKTSDHQVDGLDVKDLSSTFVSLLAKCGTKETPLLVFLDNIDAMTDGSEVGLLKWIPARLPSYVKLVLSLTYDNTKEVSQQSKLSSPIPRRPSLHRLKSSKSFNGEVTVASAQKSSCLETLITRFAIREENQNLPSNPAAIPSLSDDNLATSAQLLSLHNDSDNFSIAQIVKKMLKTENRCLTDDKMELLLASISSYPHPLAAAIGIHLTSCWPSWKSREDCITSLPQHSTGLEGFAHSLFQHFEDRYGRPLVAATSSYITLSLHGLTGSELSSLIARDENVFSWTVNLAKTRLGKIFAASSQTKVVKHNSQLKAKFDRSQTNRLQGKVAGLVTPKGPPTIRIPEIIWRSFMDELNFCLVETLSDELLTMRWRHDVYGQVCALRYLTTNETKLSYHNNLARYFSNEPCLSSGRSGGRMSQDDPCQSLLWNVKITDWTKGKTATRLVDGSRSSTMKRGRMKQVCNLRRLVEAPHQFLSCRTLEEMKDEMLCNYEWLQAKLQGSSYQSLMEVMSSALVRHPSDKDLRLLVETLYLSRDVVKADPGQLGSQLVGRLYDIIKKDKPLARLDPRKFPSCRKLLSQCRRSPTPVLVPSSSCLLPPNETLIDMHVGHTDVITAMAISSDGQIAVTAAKDETMKIWDLYSRQVRSTIVGTPSFITSLTLCKGNNFAVLLDRSNKIHVFSLLTKLCVFSLPELPGRVTIGVAGDGHGLLVIYYDSLKVIKVWDLEKLLPIHKIDISSDDDVTLRNDQWLVAARNCVGDRILFSFRFTEQAYVYNAKRAKQMQTLRVQLSGDHLILHVEMSREYYVISCTRQYMHLHEMVTFELYDVINYGHVRSIRACPDDHVFAVFINRLGSHLVGLCQSGGGTEIAVWNVETGLHQHIAKQTTHSNQGGCVDLQYCITVNDAECFLRVHNLAARIDERTMSRTQIKKSALGIGEFYPVACGSRYVVARGMENGPITVWNVTRGRCKGEAVSIERALHEDNDAVIVKDVMVVILSDRGSGRASQPIFTTILIYDLQTKKYTKKLHPVEVTVCPHHEYRIISNDRLLGVSHNRRHFTIWSLHDGQIVSTIAPDFSKCLLVNKVGNKEMKWKSIRRKPNAEKKRATTSSLKEASTICVPEEERNKLIDQILLSGDEQTLLSSFYGHHVAVFDIESGQHSHTLTNQHSMMLLHQAKITHSGCHLVHTNYDEDFKISYITVWDLTRGKVARRLKNEPLVYALDVSRDASTVIFVTEDNFLKIWKPFKRGGHRKIPGYEGLRMREKSNNCQGTTIYLTRNEQRAILFSHDISLWDIEGESVLARFTPDVPFQCCTVAMNGDLIIAGMENTASVVTLRLLSHHCDVTRYGRAVLGDKNEMFGEKIEKDSESSGDEIMDD